LTTFSSMRTAADRACGYESGTRKRARPSATGLRRC
jgi:hypothetical protein